MTTRWSAVAILLVLAGACGGDADVTTSSEMPERVVGLITEIEPEDGVTPNSFVVEEDDGDTFTIEVDTDTDYGFDLHHVYEHFENDEPVDVTVEEHDGALVATDIADVE